MLSRFITRTSHIRFLTLISSKNHFSSPKSHPYHPLHPPLPNCDPNFSFFPARSFSSNQKNDGGRNKENTNDQPTPTSEFWNLSTENEQNIDSVFSEETGSLKGISGNDAKPEDEYWLRGSMDRVDNEDDIFKGADKEVTGNKIDEDRGNDWLTADGYKPWSLVEEEKGDEMFDIGEEALEIHGGVGGDSERVEMQKSEEAKKLEEEEKFLSTVLKGPNRAFGDLIAASGITEAMLDSLIALKDLDGVQGLPPLREIEDMRYEKKYTKIHKS